MDPTCSHFSRKENFVVTLWEVDIHPAEGQPDLLALAITSGAADLGLEQFAVETARGFLIQGDISEQEIARASQELLADLVVEVPLFGRPGEPSFKLPASMANRDGGRHDAGGSTLVHVLPKPGVMDPVAASTLAAIKDLGIAAEAVVTLRKLWLNGWTGDRQMLKKLLANDSIEQVVFGPLDLDRIHLGSDYQF